VFQAVCKAVDLCQSRNEIAGIGIIPVLERLSTINATTLRASLAAAFLEVCVKAQAYEYAQRRVGTHWPTAIDTDSINDVVQYFSLRATVHASMQEFSWAIRCAKAAIAVPSHSVSPPQLAILKKAILWSCLNNVEFDVPSSVSSAVSRLWKNCDMVRRYTLDAADHSHFVKSKEKKESIEKDEVAQLFIYRYCATAFLDSNQSVLMDICTKNQSLLSLDGNEGWIDQCFRALFHRHLGDLSSLYATISLSKVSELTGQPQERVVEAINHLAALHGWDAVIDNEWVEWTPLSIVPSNESLLSLALHVREMESRAVATAPAAAKGRPGKGRSNRGLFGGGKSNHGGFGGLGGLRGAFA